VATSRHATAADVAANLNLSTRTLHGKLSAGRATFGNLLIVHRIESRIPARLTRAMR